MRFSRGQLDRASSEPLYIQVFHRLREAIGKTDPKGPVKLPSTTELAERFGVSQNTIRSAMRMLTEARLVCRIRHRGTIPVSCMLPEDPQLDNRSIGLVFPMEGYTFWQPILKLMHDDASAAGYSLDIFLYKWNELADERRALNQAFRNCSGIILYGNSRSADRELVEEFNRERPPLILFLLYFENLDASIVASDGYSAAGELTEQLVRAGSRRPLFCYQHMNNTMSLRIAGFKDALLRCGIEFRPEMVQFANAPDFRQKIRQLAPDSLICDGLNTAGNLKKIPSGRIVVFQASHLDSPQFRGTIRKVTSPTDLIAQAAIDEVLRRIRDPKAYRRKILVRMKIQTLKS